MQERLRLLRKQRNLTQEQVALEIGISTRAYSHYEQGSRDIPIDILRRLCIFFEVSADYVIGLSDFPERN